MDRRSFLTTIAAAVAAISLPAVTLAKTTTASTPSPTPGADKAPVFSCARLAKGFARLEKYGLTIAEVRINPADKCMFGNNLGYDLDWSGGTVYLWGATVVLDGRVPQGGIKFVGERRTEFVPSIPSVTVWA